MLIIGVDYHPSDQYIAFADTETGECGERRLNHSDGEAEKFYRDLQQRAASVRVGMEATGYSRWFERLLAELGIEVWIGDAAKIKTKRVRKQKTDRNDAQLLLTLLIENNFPRVWVPSPENRDLRQLLWHRHRLVQMRTRIMNQLQALAMNEGNRRKKKLWSAQGRAQLEKLPLATWASRRRQDLLDLLDPGSHDSSHRRVNGGGRTGSPEALRSAAADDPSWRRTDHRAGLRADHRNSGAVSVWQADRQLYRADSFGRFQCGATTARTHQQARQRAAALFAGRGGTGSGAL
jgi:transposase